MTGEMNGKPTRDCFCGAAIKGQPLPVDLARLSGKRIAWVHVETEDDRCYPDSSDEESAQCLAAPCDELPTALRRR